MAQRFSFRWGPVGQVGDGRGVRQGEVMVGVGEGAGRMPRPGLPRGDQMPFLGALAALALFLTSTRPALGLGSEALCQNVQECLCT